MPYIQKQTNNYFGFMPVVGAGETIQVNPYLVSSSEASDINIGDVCVFTTLATVRIITGAFTPSSSGVIAGVAASRVRAGDGSTGVNLNLATSQVCLMYDSPTQKYVVCDTTSGVIGSQIGTYKKVPILSTGCVGSTGPNSTLGRSVMAISGVPSTAVGAFHVFQMHPVEQGIYSTVGAATAGSAVNVRKWIGQLAMTAETQSTGLFVVNTTS